MVPLPGPVPHPRRKGWFVMKRSYVLWPVSAVLLALTAVFIGAEPPQPSKEAMTKELWPAERLAAAAAAVEKQKAAGLLSDASYQKRMKMLQARQAGTYQSESLSVTDPPLNFIQNGGFEKLDKNSARNRSRWMWWGGWDWGGDYENSWEDRPQYVHSGQYSARIKCTGKKGRIGINTPALPIIPGATEYKLTFWGSGAGDNMIFVNFESGASGTLREKIPPNWKQYTVIGKPEAGAKTYTVFLYVIGEGTIWLDDVELVPVGGKVE
jgi:hypothetical protein